MMKSAIRILATALYLCSAIEGAVGNYDAAIYMVLSDIFILMVAKYCEE